MDDDRWRSCGSDWDDPGTGPGRLSGDDPGSAPDDRSAGVDPGTRTAARSVTGPISPRPDLGDCA